MAIGTTLFLLSNGLSVARAPYPRERFLTFAVLGGCIGLLTGVPAAMMLAVAAIAADARAAHEQREEEREVERQRTAGYWPHSSPPPYGWR